MDDGTRGEFCLRKLFAEILLKEMGENPNIFLITTDLGYGIWDDVRNAYPERFINTGAAEQAAAGIAVGLALSGKIPVVYSITPFLLYRPYEFWRIYLEHEGIPVKLVGSGRGTDYAKDGITHDASDDWKALWTLSKVKPYYPKDDHSLSNTARDFLYSPNPAYLNLRR